jgi:hypothetical protein
VQFKIILPLQMPPLQMILHPIWISFLLQIGQKSCETYGRSSDRGEGKDGGGDKLDCVFAPVLMEYIHTLGF